MKHYEFVNKLWVQNAPKNRAIRLLLVILGSVLLFISFVQILMDGIKEVNWFLGILLPVLLIIQGFLFTRQGRYVSSLIIIEMESEKMVFNYPNINRLDKTGTHSETITIDKASVYHFQFSKMLNSIRIISRPIIEIITDSSSNTLYYTNSPPYELVLYPPADEMENIIASVENCLGRRVEYMDI